MPAARGMLQSEAFAAGILRAQCAILGLFQETGLHIPQGMVHMENVVIAGGTFTVINVHDLGSGGDSWASKACFFADVAMYAEVKSAQGTWRVVIGGDFNLWLESLGHHTTKRFVALCEQCGSLRAGHSAEEDRQHTREGHRLDSYLLNAPLVPSGVMERFDLQPPGSVAREVGLADVPC